MGEKVVIGTIKRVFKDRQSGFILPMGESEEIKVHFTFDDIDTDNPKEGQLVQFIEDATDAERPKAKRITVLSEKS